MMTATRATPDVSAAVPVIVTLRLSMFWLRPGVVSFVVGKASPGTFEVIDTSVWPGVGVVTPRSSVARTRRS